MHKNSRNRIMNSFAWRVTNEIYLDIFSEGRQDVAIQFFISECDFSFMERVAGFEPVTSCLGSKHSTAELHPLRNLTYFTLNSLYL